MRLDAKHAISIDIDHARDYRAGDAAAIDQSVSALRSDSPFEIEPRWHVDISRSAEAAYVFAEAA